MHPVHYTEEGVKAVARIIYAIHDEKDKDFECDLGWVCEVGTMADPNSFLVGACGKALTQEVRVQDGGGKLKKMELSASPLCEASGGEFRRVPDALADEVRQCKLDPSLKAPSFKL